MTSTSSISRATKLAALALGATAAVACSDSTGPTGPRGLVQFINAAPQLAKIDVHVGTTNSVNNLQYGQYSQLFVRAADTAQAFTAYDSTGTTSLDAQNITVTDGDAYTLVLIQSSPAGALVNFLYLPDTVSAPSSGHAKLRFINTSPSAPLIDLYVLANGSGTTELNAATPSAHVAYSATFPYTEIPSGSHRLVLTIAGTKTVLVDRQNLNFTNGSATTFLSLDAAGGGTPISAFYWSER